MPYLFRNPDDYPDELDGVYDEETSPDYFHLRSTAYGSPSEQNPVVRYSALQVRLRQFDVLPNTIGIPLVSPRVLEVLMRFCPNDLQGVKASINTRDGIVDGFSFLKVLTEVHAIDMEKSAYVLIRGTSHPRKFNRLVLKRDALGDHHFARDPNYGSYVFVSDEVKTLFDSAGWKSYDNPFKRPEEVHP